MDWLRTVLYGFISGLTEFLPVSSAAHGEMVLKILGADSNQTMLSLLTQIGMLAAVLYFCRGQFRSLSRGRNANSRRKRAENQDSILTLRLFRSTLIPLIVCYLFAGKAAAFSGRMNIIAIFLVINGIVLFLPELFPAGNKDARSVSGFHSLVLGLGAGSSIFPGMSCVGTVSSFGSILGLNRQFALEFAFLMTVPVLTLGIISNVAALILGGLGTITAAIAVRYLLAAVMAFFGGFCGISLMRFLSAGTGYSWFAYYCWGAALFSFILFMTI